MDRVDMPLVDFVLFAVTVLSEGASPGPYSLQLEPTQLKQLYLEAGPHEMIDGRPSRVPFGWMGMDVYPVSRGYGCFVRADDRVVWFADAQRALRPLLPEELRASLGASPEAEAVALDYLREHHPDALVSLDRDHRWPQPPVGGWTPLRWWWAVLRVHHDPRCPSRRYALHHGERVAAIRIALAADTVGIG